MRSQQNRLKLRASGWALKFPTVAKFMSSRRLFCGLQKQLTFSTHKKKEHLKNYLGQSSKHKRVECQVL